MGSLAMLFGLLFLVGLLAAIYKILVRRPGALWWLACSLAGLALYSCLFFFLPAPVPLKSGPSSPVTNSQASAMQSTPAPVSTSPATPPAEETPNTTAKSVYAPPAATVKSVYVPAGTARSVYAQRQGSPVRKTPAR